MIHRKFFVGGVTTPDEAAQDQNVAQFIRDNVYFIHKDTTHKGEADKIGVGDIIILKYLRKYIAYGEVISINNEESEAYIYKFEIQEWLLYDAANHHIGIARNGISENVSEVHMHALVKEVTTSFALDKIKQFNHTNSLYQQLMNLMESPQLSNTINDYIKLLQYKKQIILQGPPGTGKTRLAKEIAEKILVNNIEVDIDFLKSIIKPGTFFKTVKGIVDIEVIEVNEDGFVFRNSGTKEYRKTFSSILEIWKNNRGLSGDITNGTLSFEGGINKYIQKNLNERIANEQIKIVQFHPAYTYEDFVRGIVAKPNTEGDGIVYEAENKLLGYLAQVANENYRASQIDINNTSVEMNVFDAFIEMIKEKMTLNDFHKYDITEAVYLFDADETRFKYKGDNWKAHSKGLNMKFSELNKIIKSGAQDRQDIKKMPQLEELTRQHATYFMKVVEQYYTFRNNYKSPKLVSKPILKNYVLIIDEINRANLSAVLGELIYALEYRGDAVESMYEVDGENKLILPPNLYIIGTMNTADRSVGHIDYAIRRRFAFVDVPSKDLAADSNLVFDQKLFNQVQQFIKEHISNEFDVTDIQLGHSYFIDKSNEGGSMAIRLQYEIKPILLEYVKDGVLVGDDLVSRINQLNSSI